MASDCHIWQLDRAKEAPAPILNAACKEDPAKLGSRLDAVNFDLLTRDPHTRTDLTRLPNFVQGSVLDMDTIFEPEEFGSIVLGEYIEHCLYHVVEESLVRCYNVLKTDGHLIITYPLDGRTPEVQHDGRLVVWLTGKTGHDITEYHQTVWETEEIVELAASVGFELVKQESIHYGFIKDRMPQGWGMVFKRLAPKGES